jgi:transcriptional regulator with XRE-family HTH domain
MAWPSIPSLATLGAVGDPLFERQKRKLAQSIRRRRRQLGLTQEEAAGASDIAPRHYQKLEAGELNVTLRTLVKIGEALHVSLAELLQ